MTIRKRQTTTNAGAQEGQPRRRVLPTFAGTGVLPGVDISNSAALLQTMSDGERPAVDRSHALSILALAKPVLAQRFGVVELALFGSVARNAAGPESDVDVLVAFSGPATSARYFGVQFFLEDLFGRPVDLVTSSALRAELRPFVEREATHV